MPHPIVEALYIGLLTSGLSQPVADPPRPVLSEPDAAAAVQTTMRRRVVYDWRAGERLVYESASETGPGRGPIVGITEEQVVRMTGSTSS